MRARVCLLFLVLFAVAVSAKSSGAPPTVAVHSRASRTVLSYAPQHAGHTPGTPAPSLSVAVDGSVSPELIPDELAYGHFLLQWAGLMIELGYATNLSSIGMRLHHVWGQDDVDPVEYLLDPMQPNRDRVINFNVGNSSSHGPMQGHWDQKAVRIQDGVIPEDPNALGGTYSIGCPSSGGRTPNDVTQMIINVQFHQTHGSNQGNNQTQIANEMRRTVGHEVGHGVHLMHRGNTNACGDNASLGTVNSIMSSGWANGPVQTDPLAQYNQSDVQQIRLHQR